MKIFLMKLIEIAAKRLRDDIAQDQIEFIAKDIEFLIKTKYKNLTQDEIREIFREGATGQLVEFKGANVKLSSQLLYRMFSSYTEKKAFNARYVDEKENEKRKLDNIKINENIVRTNKIIMDKNNKYSFQDWGMIYQKVINKEL